MIAIKAILQVGFISAVAYAVFDIIRYFVWCRKLSKALCNIKGVSDKPHWLWGDLIAIKKAGSLTDLRASAFDRLPNERFLKAFLGPMPVLMGRDFEFFKYVTNNQTGSPTPFQKVHSAEWALHRATLAPLLNHKNLEKTVEFANTLYDRLERLWDSELTAQSTQSESAIINFDEYASQLAAGTVIHLVFSLDVGVLKQSVHILPPMIEKFEQAQHETEKLMRLPPFMSNWPIPARIQLYRRCRESDDEFQAIIKQRRDNIQDKFEAEKDPCQDALDLMLSPAIKPPYSNEAIHDNILALCWAGHRPATIFMSWCIYYLAKYPQHQETIYEEVAALPRPFVYDDIAHCKNLENFMNEVLRIISIAPALLRQSTTDNTNYDGLHLPKGLWVLASIFDMHRDPAYFDRPTEFDPERELSANNKFVPFSGGEKRCLGMKLARIETRAFIAAIVRGYRVQLVSGANYNVKRHFLCRPEAGMTIRIQKRCV